MILKLILILCALSCWKHNPVTSLVLIWIVVAEDFK